MRVLLFLLVFASTFVVSADDNIDLVISSDKPLRPVTSSIMIGGGTLRLTDNYLSPFRTSGWYATVSAERIQAHRSRPEKMAVWMAGSVDLGRTHTIGTTNGPMWRAMLHAEGGLLWKLPVTFKNISIAAGGQLELDAGADYRPANGNNPVAAQAALSVAPTVHLQWQTHISSLPVNLGYHGSLPLAGIFFAPEYGELYYEIYLGARQGLVHFAWPGSRLSYHHLLYADFQFGATALRIGYDFRGLTQSANNLATNVLSNMLMIGITTTRLSINPSAARRSPNIVLGL